MGILDMCVTDVDLVLLERSTKYRLKSAHRPGTLANRNAQFKLYFSFCERYKRSAIDPDVWTLCLYAEFLARSFRSFKSLSNYLSAVNTLHKLLDKSCQAFEAFRFKLMKRALYHTMDHVIAQKLPSLLQIFKSCAI